MRVRAMKAPAPRVNRENMDAFFKSLRVKSRTILPAVARGRVSRAVLGMLALIFLIERSIARNTLDFRDLTSWVTAQAAEQTRVSAVSSELLILGDSLVKFGVQPKVVESRTGRPSYNLAIGAGSAVTTHYILERALEAGARPQALVVDYFQKHLNQDPRTAIREDPELLETPQCLDFAWTSRDPIFLASIMTDRLIPSSRFRRQIRENLQTWLAGKAPPGRFHTPIWMRNIRANQGAMLALQDSEPPSQSGVDLKLLPQNLSRDPLNVTYLRRTMRLAAARRIPIFWVIPPVEMKAHSAAEGAVIEASYWNFVREIQREFPTVTILDASRSGYPRTAFFDLVHLDGEGALCLSTDVANVLRRSLDENDHSSRPRWIDLPAYRAISPDGPLEGFAESLTALRASRNTTLR
jgi:hypothetical protein